MSGNVAIMIFARAPVAGACKTRLIPALGAEGAARLHARLIERMIETALASNVGPVGLWCAGDAEHEFFRHCATHYGVELRAQCEGDLGARMLDAFTRTGGPALLTGSDAAGVTAQDLRSCAEALTSHDAVFLPAEDGGYGLVGLNAPQPSIFANMRWSHAQVMDDTRVRLREAGLSFAEPRVVFDIDEPADIARLDPAFWRDLQDGRA